MVFLSSFSKCITFKQLRNASFYIISNLSFTCHHTIWCHITYVAEKALLNRPQLNQWTYYSLITKILLFFNLIRKNLYGDTCQYFTKFNPSTGGSQSNVQHALKLQCRGILFQSSISFWANTQKQCDKHSPWIDSLMT